MPDPLKGLSDRQLAELGLIVGLLALVAFVPGWVRRWLWVQRTTIALISRSTARYRRTRLQRELRQIAVWEQRSDLVVLVGIRLTALALGNIIFSTVFFIMATSGTEEFMGLNSRLEKFMAALAFLSLLIGVLNMQRLNLFIDHMHSLDAYRVEVITQIDRIDQRLHESTVPPVPR